MPTVGDVAAFLEVFAPSALAEEWDNVGLLLGDRAAPARRIMTCLTITPGSAAEAVDDKVDLIVAHHPLPFRALKRITTDAHEGRLLWKLIGAKTSVYSPHTAFDSAVEGINQRLAEGLELVDIEVLLPKAEPVAGRTMGAGRRGRLASPLSLAEFAQRVKSFLAIDRLQAVGQAQRRVEHVAIGCGSAGEFLEPAQAAGCDLLLTGETRFHTSLEAESRGMGMILAGHYATERFAVERLAEVLTRQFSDARIWASRRECDPLEWL
jgi:dinuclear metal center YbgI/SA1388 family protein